VADEEFHERDAVGLGESLKGSTASGGSGETQFMFTTSDGHLWHTLRRADGSWTG